jgi:ABC-type lipopolysaccharide export system ATPase subunit
MRLGASVTAADVAEKVEAVLRELRLTHLRARQSFWGSAAQMSGGERQR